MASGSEYGGSVSTVAKGGQKVPAERPHSQQVINNMQRDGSESSLNVRPVSQIQAWKQKGSHHRKLIKDRKDEDILKKA